MPPGERPPNYRDLTGEQFGSLTVVEDTEERTRGRRRKNGRWTCGAVLWLCECCCGRQIRATTSNLTRGNTRSCGASPRCYPILVARRAEIVAARRAGETVEAIAAAQKLSAALISVILCRELGDEQRALDHRLVIDPARIRAMHAEGLNGVQMAEALGVSPSAVHKCCRKLGLTLPLGKQRQEA